MKKFIKFIMFLFSIFIGVSIHNEVCFAKTNIYDGEQHDYEISLIDTTVNVSNSNIYSISERVTVDHYNNEKLCKVIPLVYDGVRRNVSNVKVENIMRKYVIYETKEKGNNLYIYFNNEVSLPTETFKITYDYDMGYDFDDKKDMFYFDFIGKDLNHDVKKLDFTINLPSFFDVAKMKVYSTNLDLDHDLCNISIYGKTVKGETRQELTASNNLIVSIKFDDGFFKVKKSFKDMIPDYTVISIILILTVFLVILIKDKLIIRHYTSNLALMNIKNKMQLEDANKTPKQLKLNPMEISYISNDGVSAKDVLCMLYYWQEKGYIEVEKQNRDYKILFNEIFIKGPKYEINLYNYFYDLSQNRILYLSCIGSDFNLIAKRASIDMVSDLVHNKKIYNYKYRKCGRIFRKLSQILFSIFVGIVCYKVMGLKQALIEGTIVTFAIINFVTRFLMNVLNQGSENASSSRFINAIIYIIALVLAFFLAKHIPDIEIYNYARFDSTKWELLCVLIGLILNVRLSFNEVPFTKKGLEIKYILDNYKSKLRSIKREYTENEVRFAIAFDIDPILMSNKELMENEFITYGGDKIKLNR